MSNYFRSLTSITLDDINKTLTAVSNIVAPIDEDEEEDDLNSNLTNDIANLASTISTVGGMVKSSIIASSAAVTNSGINDSYAEEDTSFEDIALSPEPKDQVNREHEKDTKIFSGPKDNSNNSLMNNFFSNLIPKKDTGVSNVGRSYAALNIVELEKKVQTHYFDRMEREFNKLSTHINKLETEKLLLISQINSQTNSFKNSSTDSSKLGQVELLNSHVQSALDESLKKTSDLEKALEETKAKYEDIVCKLINEQETLANEIRDKDNFIESLKKELASSKETIDLMNDSNLNKANDTISNLEISNNKLIEELQGLENSYSICNAEKAEILFAYELEQRTCKSLKETESDLLTQIKLFESKELSYISKLQNSDDQINSIKNELENKQQDLESIKLKSPKFTEIEEENKILHNLILQVSKLYPNEFQNKVSNPTDESEAEIFQTLNDKYVENHVLMLKLESQESTLERLKKEIDDYKLKDNSAAKIENTNIQQLNDQFLRLNEETALKNIEIQNLNDLVESLKSEHKEYIEKCNIEKKDYSSMIQKFEKDIIDYQNEKDKFKDSINDIVVYLIDSFENKLKITIDIAKSDDFSVFSKIKDYIDILFKENIQLKEDKISGKSKTVTMLLQENEKLNKEIQDLKISLNEIQSKSETEEILIKDKNNEINYLNSIIQENKISFEQINSQLQDLSDKNVTIESSLKLSETEKDSMQIIIAENEEICNNQKNSINSLNSELVDLKALNSELTTSCSEKDKKISELYDNLNRVTAVSKLLESNQDSEVVKLQKANEEMSKLNDSLSIGNERIKKLEQDLEINFKTKEELIVSLNTSEGMCQTLKSSLEAMRNSENERSELIEQKDVECKQLHSIIVQLRQQLQTNQSNEVQFKTLQNDLSNKTNDLNASISREESLNNQIKSMQTNISDLTRLHEVQASDVSNFKESLELKEKECLQLKEVINQLRHQLQNKITQKGNATEDYKIKYDSLLIEFNNLSKTLSENLLLLTEKNKEYNELIENSKSCRSQSDESNQIVIKLRADYDSINHQLHDSFKELENLKANELLLLNEKKGFEIKIISYEETLSELNKKLDELSSRPKESQADPKSQMLAQQLQKVETENRQLHQVILQLRNVRKVGKEDADTLQAERDELKKLCENLQSENNKLNDSIKSLKQTSSAATELDREVQALQIKITEYEEARAEGMKIIDDKKREIAKFEKVVYDIQSSLDVALSDNLLLKEDLGRKDLEINNLHAALTGTENDKEMNIIIVSNDYERKLKALETNLQQTITLKDQEWKLKLEESQSELIKKEQLLQDALILRRKADLDLNAEKRKMQKTIETAISQLRNTQDDVIDRALIANLLVSYFKRRRSKEVMDLIAKILNFDDDQKVAVGLKVGTIGFRHAVGSIFQTIVGTTPAKTPQEIEGENLAELWVNFLLEETGGNEKLPNRPKNILIGGSSSDNSDSENEIGSFTLSPPSPTIAKSKGNT